VVIGYLNIVGITVTPSEADAPLIVDPNAVLPSTISFELLKSVPWWQPQICQLLGRVQYQQLPQGASLQPCRANMLAFEQPLRITIAEAVNHVLNITPAVNNGKRY